MLDVFFVEVEPKYCKGESYVCIDLIIRYFILHITIVLVNARRYEIIFTIGNIPYTIERINSSP